MIFSFGVSCFLQFLLLTVTLYKLCCISFISLNFVYFSGVLLYVIFSLNIYISKYVFAVYFLPSNIIYIAAKTKTKQSSFDQ